METPDFTAAQDKIVAEQKAKLRGLIDTLKEAESKADSVTFRQEVTKASFDARIIVDELQGLEAERKFLKVKQECNELSQCVANVEDPIIRQKLANATDKLSKMINMSNCP